MHEVSSETSCMAFTWWLCMLGHQHLQVEGSKEIAAELSSKASHLVTTKMPCKWNVRCSRERLLEGESCCWRARAGCIKFSYIYVLEIAKSIWQEERHQTLCCAATKAWLVADSLSTTLFEDRASEQSLDWIKKRSEGEVLTGNLIGPGISFRCGQPLSNRILLMSRDGQGRRGGGYTDKWKRQCRVTFA